MKHSLKNCVEYVQNGCHTGYMHDLCITCSEKCKIGIILPCKYLHVYMSNRYIVEIDKDVLYTIYSIITRVIPIYCVLKYN